MADTKISALPASTVPLAGTEVLPIVQSSATRQVSVANLTAGRAVSALSVATTTGATFATTSGSVAIGTASASNKLTVYDTSAPQVTFDNGTSTFIVGNSAGGGNNKLLYGTGAYPMIFYTNATDAMRIDATQNLLVGATTSGVANGGIQLQPAGNGASIPFFGMGGNSSSNSQLTLGVYSTSLAQYQFYVGYAGTVFARSVVISSLSDARLKENIVDLDVGLDKIMALKPRKFDWKEGQGTNTKNVRGFIAQELEQVFPDLIDEWRDPAPEGEDPYKSVRQDLMPVLVKAMQEQQALITALTARIEALENK